MRRRSPGVSPRLAQLVASAVLLAPVAPLGAAGAPKRILRLNMCTDELLLRLADRVNTVKQRVIAAIANEEEPYATESLADRIARTSVRVALRQLKALGHRSRALPGWMAVFDRVNDGGEDDEATRWQEH